jgi:hypothetical protein
MAFLMTHQPRLIALSTLLVLPLACGGSGSEDRGTDDSTGTLTLGEDEVGSETAETGSTGDTTATDSSSDSSDSGTDDTTETDDTGTADTTDTTDTDTTDETTETDDATTGDLPCDEFQVTIDPLPPNVMLVLDKSGGMFTQVWDHDNDVGTPTITRWNSLHQVTDNMVTNFEDQINFGMTLFPSTAAQNVYNAPACVTANGPEVDVGPLNAAAILGAIPGALVTMSFGGTPATAGVQNAYDHLLTLDPDVPRAMVLVTDGAANCRADAANVNEMFESYDVALPVLVGDAYVNDGIPTYVVGIDISNQQTSNVNNGEPNGIIPSQKLNEVAQAGGTVSFFNSQDQIELEAALNEVIESVQTCLIPLAEPPVFPEFTEVIVEGVEWPMITDCDTEDGWLYSNPFDTILLCGAACEALKLAGDADIEYYCNPG